MFSEENNKSTYIDTQFNILLNGYEGPIDLLLELSRKQKVDLSEISILDLAEQYLKFIENYNTIHLEIAADYLVMAAWLTYLKSRLLLPKDETTEEYSSEELEEALRYQLQRLEAMQNISKKLYVRPLIGRDVFYGGSIEGINVKYNNTIKNPIHSLNKILPGRPDSNPITHIYSDKLILFKAMTLCGSQNSNGPKKFQLGPLKNVPIIIKKTHRTDQPYMKIK